MTSPFLKDGKVIGSIVGPDLSGNTYYVVDDETFTGTPAPGAQELSGTPEDQYNKLLYVAGQLRQPITELPAEAAGLHWYKDRLYAVAPVAYYTEAPPALLCELLDPTATGEPYSYTYVATGGVLPLTWSILEGQLPPGLSLSPSTGTVSGIPTQAGNYMFTVRVTDARGLTSECNGQMLLVRETLTSTLYPVEVIEAIDSAGDFTSATELTAPVDAVDSLGDFSGGELRSILQTYSMQAEAIDSAGDFLAGEIRTILLAYNMEAEAIDSTGDFVGGSIATILVTNTMSPEAIDSAGDFVGGTLS